MTKFTAKLVQLPAYNWPGGTVRLNFEATDPVAANAFTQAIAVAMNSDRQHFMQPWSGFTELGGE